MGSSQLLHLLQVLDVVAAPDLSVDTVVLVQLHEKVFHRYFWVHFAKTSEADISYSRVTTLSHPAAPYPLKILSCIFHFISVPLEIVAGCSATLRNQLCNG